MIDSRRMLEWSDGVHESWWSELEDVDPSFLAENREASFHSVLGLLTHVGNVESAWMDVLEGDEPDWARHSTKKWEKLPPVRDYVERARERTWGLVEDLSQEELEAEVPVPPHFARDAYTVDELLFTVVSHECFHRGEVLALFWQEDTEPPTCDYPHYGTPLSASGTKG
jgi:uncharacterized damage-inducible protein DinB